MTVSLCRLLIGTSRLLGLCLFQLRIFLAGEHQCRARGRGGIHGDARGGGVVQASAVSVLPVQLSAEWHDSSG